MAGCFAALCRRDPGRRNTVTKRPVLVTGADLAPQALALLAEFDLVYAGKAPTEDDVVRLCKQHDPVGIIVRYSRVGHRPWTRHPA